MKEVKVRESSSSIKAFLLPFYSFQRNQLYVFQTNNSKLQEAIGYHSGRARLCCSNKQVQNLSNSTTKIFFIIILHIQVVLLGWGVGFTYGSHSGTQVDEIIILIRASMIDLLLVLFLQRPLINTSPFLKFHQLPLIIKASFNLTSYVFVNNHTFLALSESSLMRLKMNKTESVLFQRR